MIVSTKLHIPQVRNSLVQRPRLLQKLDEGLQAKLCLISAQAGYGKTTTLSQWARQYSGLVAWVSLDKQDNDWIPFWSCVAVSIREQVPGFGEPVESYLEKGQASSYVPSDPAIKALLNELNLLPDALALILDDFHFIDMPAIHDSLSYLLEHMPPHIHLYIASRTEPAFPTARLLANGDMQRILMEDLRFEPDEGLAFFQARTDVPLTKEQATELIRQTEGWVSGLQLAAISLKKSPNMAESIRQFGGRQHHIARYLLEEVFRHLDEPLRDFMLETSILTRLNRSLCEAVTGQANCQEQLSRLEQLNLFIFPLDDEHYWYRYHHLLSEFLKQTLANGGPDKWAQAHTKAAHWLERHGLQEEAAEHYLEGKQYDDVVRLIEGNLHAFLHKKMAALSRWILQVPESFILKRPMVEMFYLLVLLGIGHGETSCKKIEQAKLRYEALQGKMDEAELNEVLGNIYFLCAASSYFQKDLEGVSKYFELVERYLPEGSFFQLVGNNNYQGFEQFHDPLAFINDYHASAAFLSKWIQKWNQNKAHPFVGTLYASYSKLLYEWNRLEESEYWINQVLRPHDMPHNTRSLVLIYAIASQIQQTLGNPARAAELLEQLKLQIDSPDYDLHMRDIEAEQACLLLRQGFVPYGMEWLNRCGMSSTDEAALNRVAEHLALARILQACGRAEEALSLLERLYVLLSKEDRLRDRIKVLVLQSVALHRIGQTEKALVRLESALGLAEPQGFIRSFVDEGSLMTELLTAALKKLQRARKSGGTAISPAYIKQLLQALNGSQPSGELSPGKIRVHCFGRFRVLAGPEDGNEIQWRTSKAEELMAYLVHHRGEAVDRHRIMDTLWRDLDADKAAANLNITVHYLRKNLKSKNIEGILQHSRGFYKIDASRIDCDYFELVRLSNDDVPVTDSNNAFYEEAARSYKGEYLKGNDYLWAEQIRSSLENEYVNILLQLHNYYISKQSFTSAVKVLKKAIACTPWNEDIHTKLIRLYVLMNDRTGAMKQYDALRRVLRAEFGAEPGEVVKKLLSSI
ncbi:MAG: hypothetical protein K0Q94_2057 [Paenibacillus sp.]|nr:hypothetical protein [Paenibacillus sp.]